MPKWEKAEVERSYAQAVRTGAQVKPTSPKILTRYLDPPADTAYVRGRAVRDFGAGDGRDTTLLAQRGAHV